MAFTNGLLWKFVPFVLSWSMIQTTTYALFLPPCEDLYTGNCTQDFGDCTNPNVQILCPKTCGACPTTTTTTTTTPAPCIDMYDGDCGVFSNICDQHDAQILCPKSCGVCLHTTTTTTATSTTTTTTTTTVATTTTTRTTTTTKPCLDKYLGDCSVAFPNCSGLVAQFACARSCGLCTVPYKKDCMDLYTGSCAADYAHRCNDTDVDILCPLTCGMCTNTTGTFRPPTTIQASTTTTLKPTTTTTTAPTTTTMKPTTTTTTATTTTTTPVTTTEVPCEDKYRGDCMAAFGIGNCGDQFVQIACRKFCGLCTSTTSPFFKPTTTTQEPTTTTLEPPATSQASTTSTFKPTTTTEAVPAPTTTTTPIATCTDLYPGGSCPPSFNCAEHSVQIVCPKTCGLCPPTTTTFQPTTTTEAVPTTTTITITEAPCEDTFNGDCATAPRGCDDHYVQGFCRKFCRLCT